MWFAARLLENDRVKTLRISATDVDEARRHPALAQGQVLSLAPIKALPLGRRQPRLNLRVFAEELLSLLQAGFGAPESVGFLAEATRAGSSRGVLFRLKRALDEGAPLSRAVIEQSAVFPPLLAAMIKAGESAGDLVGALRKYVHYREQAEGVKARLVSASLYPALLVVVSSAVVLFLLGFVVPRFALVYEELGDQLPQLSHVLLQLGLFVRSHGVELSMGLVIFGVIGLGVALSTDWRARVRGVADRLPLLSVLVHKGEIGQFHRALGMLLEGGTPLLPAIEVAAKLSSEANQIKLGAVRHLLHQGQAYSVATRESSFSTPLASRMLQVGEQTGDLARACSNIADYYEAELARTSDWITKLATPALMAIMGLVIGAIVVLMYLPIFQLAEAIQ